jgi:hypothetical protein
MKGLAMDAIDNLEAHYGVPLPPGYRQWVQRKDIDYTDKQGDYLWVFEAEWIPPANIPAHDLGREVTLPGLIPFAFSGAGDPWCWNTQATTGDGEYEVLQCWHDEELANAYAPTFPAWFYRDCLDCAAAVGNDEAEIDEARGNLRLWSERLAEIHPGPWAEHLASLAAIPPFQYKDPKLRMPSFGFVTTMEIETIVAAEFGRRYLDEQVAWGAW